MTFRSFTLNLPAIFRFSPYDTSTEEGRSKERYRLIGLAGSSSIFAGIIAALLGIISVPLAVGYLGKEQFGLWMVLNSLVIWIQLTDFGISNGLVNALAEANGRKDYNAARSYVTTSLVVLSLLSLILLAFLLISYRHFPWDKIINIPPFNDIEVARDSFLVLGSLFIANLPLSIVVKVFSAFQFAYVSNLAQILSALLSLIGLLIAIRLELGLPALLLITSSGPLLSNLLLWLLLRRYIPWLQLAARAITTNAIRRVARSSLPLLLYQLGSLLLNNAVPLLLARIAGLIIVADYHILLRVYLLFFFVGAAVARPFYPALREAFERADASWVVTSIRRLLILRVGLSALFSFPLLFTGDWLIKTWIGQTLNGSFGFLGWLSLMILLLCSSISSTLSEVLIVLDDIRAQIKLIFVSAFITLGGIYCFFSLYGLIVVYYSMTLSTLFPIIWCAVRLRSKLPF